MMSLKKFNFEKLMFTKRAWEGATNRILQNQKNLLSKEAILRFILIFFDRDIFKLYFEKVIWIFRMNCKFPKNFRTSVNKYFGYKLVSNMLAVYFSHLLIFKFFLLYFTNFYLRWIVFVVSISNAKSIGHKLLIVSKNIMIKDNIRPDFKNIYIYCWIFLKICVGIRLFQMQHLLAPSPLFKQMEIYIC